jgi:riboflavin biosynthesis pyrimidine reductase
MRSVLIAAMMALMRRLYPPEAATESISVLEAYDVPRTRHPNRPWIGLCMVASVDGSTVVDQRSAGLSSPTDSKVLHTLRDLADVILVGAATVRIEGYGAPARRGQRVGVVSRTGDVDPSSELFTSGAGFLVIPESAPPSDVPAIRAGVGELDLRAAVAQIEARFVQCEGGATLNAAMFDADVIDEINLTVSPQVCGGDGPRLAAGAGDLVRPYRLAQICEEDGFLFTRYLRNAPATS